MLDHEKIQERLKEYDRFEKNVWNAAIEAAAKWLETANRNDTNDAEEIRRLKK